MIVGILTVELFIGEVHSLKEKRKVLKSVIDRIKKRFNVSIAEIGEQDIWQRSTLGLSMISNEQAYVHKVFAAVVKFIETQGMLTITDYQIQLF
nr:DUF503 domain-containing protein [Pelotomaculum sp. PtaB.Bin117]